MTLVGPLGVLRLRRPIRDESICCAQDDTDTRSDVRCPLLARDRGLVFRASTGAEVGDLFVLAEQRLRRGGRGLCALVKFFHLFFYPAYA